LGYGYTFANKLHIGGVYDFSAIGQNMTTRLGGASQVNELGSQLYVVSDNKLIDVPKGNETIVVDGQTLQDKGTFYLHSFSGLMGYEYNINQNQVIMPFIKAGYTLSHHSKFDTFSDIQGKNSVGHGFNVGAGIAYSPHKNIYTALEYSYTSVYYNNKSNLGDNFIVNSQSNFAFHNVKATVGIKFNLEDLI
jgi:opacity protein-like surface antigen